MSIIGITGKAGSGKDTVAAMLLKAIPDAERHGFADAVKELAEAIDPLIESGKRLSDFLDNPYGWDSAKKHPEVRRLLQRIGTEGGRGVFGENVWIDLLGNRWAEDVPFLIIPDVRFANEAGVCDVVIRVVRPDAPDLGVNAAHASETTPIKEDYTLYNYGTLDQLEDAVAELIECLDRDGHLL
jgi:hypothetical protein